MNDEKQSVFEMRKLDLEEFRHYLLMDEKAKTTIQKYVRDVERFWDYLREEQGNEEPLEFTRETVLNFKAKLCESSIAPATVNTIIAALNKFMKWKGYYACVVKPLRLQKVMFRKNSEELTREEYMRLLETAKAMGDVKTFLIMETLGSTGIRIGELKYITVEAVRAGVATISLKGKVRSILLPKGLCRQLHSYAKRNHIKTGAVFLGFHGNPMDRSSVLRHMKAIAKEAGVPPGKVYPHNLRHLFACRFYEQTKDISRLADILGHSSVETTRIYTSISLSEQKKELNDLHLLLDERVRMA